jgi:hypothetical protein
MYYVICSIIDSVRLLNLLTSALPEGMVSRRCLSSHFAFCQAHRDMMLI